MCSTCSFVVFASAAVAHGIIVLLKKSISYFINIMYKHIFLNFGVISFINKEMVSLFQLHTYNFGLVYVVSVWRGFLFLWVLGMGYVILLWHS